MSARPPFAPETVGTLRALAEIALDVAKRAAERTQAARTLPADRAPLSNMEILANMEMLGRAMRAEAAAETQRAFAEFARGLLDEIAARKPS